jgi:hypothetical protein
VSLWETGEVITKDKLNLKTVYIGSSPPTNPADGMVWVDVSSTPPLLKMYLGGGWYSARGAPPDRVVPAPAYPSDYLDPSSASASSDTGGSLTQVYGNNSYSFQAGMRVAERVSASAIGGKLVTSVKFSLYKYGSPTGTVYFRIRRVDNDEIIATLWSADVSQLPNSWIYPQPSCELYMPTDTDVRFSIEFIGTSDSNNYLYTSGYGNQVAWGVYSTYSDGVWSDDSSKDMYIYIYCKGAPSEARDNNTDSWWQPNPPNAENAWITFDLGSTLAGVAGCRIYWPSDANYRPRAYKTQASVDGSNWDDVYEANTQPPAGWAEYYWIARSQTRYIRLLITQPGPSGTRVCEFDYYQSSIWRHGHRGD